MADNQNSNGGSEASVPLPATGVAPTPSAPPPTVVPPPVAPPAADATGQPAPTSSTVSSPKATDVVDTSTAGLTADDGDVIEHEWVDKAKQIVAKTRTDPYKQTEAMNTFKADYMKKRYNKEIRVDK